MVSPLRFVFSLLFVATIAPGSRESVTFQKRHEAERCDVKSITLMTTTFGMSKITHSLRLDRTTELFEVQPNGTVIWNGPPRQTNISTELSFFERQNSTMLASERQVLMFLDMQVNYHLTLATGAYVFYVFVNRKMVASSADGRLSYHDQLYRLDQRVIDLVKRYGSGQGIEILTREKKRLEEKWRGFCELLKAADNRTSDEYFLHYDKNAGQLVCGIKSRCPWYHLVLFGQEPAPQIIRKFDADGRHSTIGIKFIERRSVVVCNITFPDGTVALQTLDPFAITTVPTTTTTTVTTTIFAVSSATVGVIRERLDGSTFGAGGIAAVVVVSILALSVGVVLFLRRGRRIDLLGDCRGGLKAFR